MNRRGDQVGQTIWVLQCRFLLMNFAMILQVQGLGGKFLFFSFLFLPYKYSPTTNGLGDELGTNSSPQDCRDFCFPQATKVGWWPKNLVIANLTGIFVATIGEFANLYYFPANLHPIFSNNCNSETNLKPHSPGSFLNNSHMSFGGGATSL